MEPTGRLFRGTVIGLPVIDPGFMMSTAKNGDRTINGEGRSMKNPLDSLGQTVILGLVLTVVVAFLIHVIV
jgi:hypothetical protein